MRIAYVVAIVLAVIEGSWMAFDGIRALTIGDYVTPSGPRSGELGPWHHVVESVGIAPRSTLMKIVFVAFGAAWLVVASALIRRAPWALKALLLAAILTLWYLPVGTAFGLLQIVLWVLLSRSLVPAP